MEESGLKATPAPPPYTALSPDESERLLITLRTVVANNRSSDSGSYVESERLRKFILYAMAVDYQGNPQTSLTAQDRAHFATMNNALNDLYTYHASGGLSEPEVAQDTIAAYFWHHLYEPCRILCVPVGMAVIYMHYFFTFLDPFGRYQGSVHIWGDIRRTLGFEALAMKLYTDELVVIPRLISDRELQDDMLNRVRFTSRRYFTRIDGIESSTHVTDGLSGWDDLQSISYTLNDRGQKEETMRKTVHEAAGRLMDLLPARWAGQIKDCVKGLLRSKQQPQGSASVGGQKEGQKERKQVGVGVPPPIRRYQGVQVWQKRGKDLGVRSSIIDQGGSDTERT